MAMRTTFRSRTTTRRAPRVLSLLGAGLLGLTLAGLPTSASAHGVAMEPGSRSYLCYKDMIASGNQTPSNPACAAAVAQTGTTPLYNWFGVLDSNGGGRTKGYIPDGELCSGGHNGPYDFSSYNAARSDWPTTHLTAGSTIQVKYSNWAAHPGKFDVYLTKDGWTPDQPLAWDDLTLTQTVDNPPQSGGAGSDGGNYYWDLQLPQGKTGKHMLFIHWIRSDSQENFYSCSDVVFDGGNGEVTGMKGGQLSAAELAEKAEKAGIKADPVHAEHAEHAAAAGEAGLVASAEDSSTGYLPAATAVSLTGAALVFGAGAVAQSRRRRREAGRNG
ncbi:chitin-binding protein [Streptomyces sp. LamerLS-316]|uniref:lytic polysaccharide monooxygenase auxiliary activity family 9 protein n=1 Tax=unclassified Streptomyces TaxID=2593676 RepID=UPI000823F810|nr:MULTISPECIES: lytic polysaccharide monooxygenase [unclassified Streptomyces]MYQ43039.1 chitin-binding protein [Streptomyces sp. SID4921]SCK34374.1 chitin-binding protein [Streptomyces sp. LamerLS-316]